MSRIEKPIYLDYHATTPVDERVLQAMLPFFTDHYGNPSSRSHPYGWQASEAVEIARTQVADLLKVRSDEIIFTSGSTEGLNMAIKGLAESLAHKGKHIISIATEHQAVLDPLTYVSRHGFKITYLKVTDKGMIDIQQLSDAIQSDTIMVIAMWANNETGVIHDMASIGKICRDKGIAFITDATQAIGKIPVDPIACGIDILVMSGHKIYGPKGSGAIWIHQNEKKLKPVPLLHGGGHESGLRAGTLNTPGIVGLGMACKLIRDALSSDMEHVHHLRNEFEKRVISQLEEVQVNGDSNHRLPTVSNLRIDFTESQAVMTKLRTKLAISSGSACSSADPAPSHVLLAMGLTATQAKASYRISFGRMTTELEMELAAQLLIDAVQEYRSQNPVWQMFKQGIDISGLHA